MARYSVETVTRALRVNPNMPDGIREYFEAVKNRTLPQYYRKEIQREKDDYSNEIPPVDVRTMIPDTERLTKYKCQGNYVLGLCLTLRGVINDEVITDRGVQIDIEQFLSSDLNFQVGDPDNQQRIDRINSILNRVLENLG